jgi:trk system potassium uptake protein TrkH
MPAPLQLLRQPVRLRVIARNTGNLALVWSVLVLVPMAVAFRTQEIQAGLWYAAIALGAGVAGAILSRIHAPQRIQINEAMVIGSVLFLVSPLAMTVPLVALGIPVVDAYFEAVSGVTTTGLSTLSSVESKSDLFLFARSWTQWYGGLGILSLALALVTQPGALARRLSLTESFHEDGLGSTRAHFRSTLTTYGTITIAGIAALWLAGADWFEAVTYALAAVSTGGFAPHDASLAALGGPPLHFVVILLCLSCALPLTLYAHAVRGQWKQFVADAQLKSLVVAGLVASGFLTLTMSTLGSVPLPDAMTHGPVMALSAQTTAGFASLDVSALDTGSKFLMVLMMAVGGGAGSTAGGIKILRILILIRVLQAMFARMSLPKHAVYEPRISGKRVDRDEIQEALTVLLLFAATVLLSWLAFVASGYDALDSLFEVTSATGTVGLSAGIVGPDLPAGLKLVLCADMILGRLELIALFVILMPRTWIPKRRRKE